ncbi:hypothetical protein D3C78_19750 [compost metagenome]
MNNSIFKKRCDQLRSIGWSVVYDGTRTASFFNDATQTLYLHVLTYENLSSMLDMPNPAAVNNFFDFQGNFKPGTKQSFLIINPNWHIEREDETLLFIHNTQAFRFQHDLFKNWHLLEGPIVSNKKTITGSVPYDKLLITRMNCSDVSISSIGEIAVPSNFITDGLIQRYDIIESNHRHVVIEQHHVRAVSHKSIIKISKEHTFTLTDGHLDYVIKDIDHPMWLENFQSPKWFDTNPYNANEWYIQPDSVKYSSNTLMVTIGPCFFVNIGGTWIETTEDWIRDNKHLPINIIDEFQMVINFE